MYRPISNYTLEPKPGYIEVELEDGTRTLIKTPEQQERENLINENKLLKAQLKAVTESNAFLEDCIVEMAMIVYA